MGLRAVHGADGGVGEARRFDGGGTGGPPRIFSRNLWVPQLLPTHPPVLTASGDAAAAQVELQQVVAVSGGPLQDRSKQETGCVGLLNQVRPVATDCAGV